METRSDSETVTLFRPVGEKELELVRESGWSRFPQEYWIPSEELEEFNRRIVGAIQILRVFNSVIR
jgi:hypothetical protein